MTRLHVLWLHQEKIIPETGTLLRQRLYRLVHRTPATDKIADQTHERKLLLCTLK
jgi:hypothetical protein